jgi:uncharacterized protein (TIGR02466 family)
MSVLTHQFYQKGINWIIESYLDKDSVEQLKKEINSNLDLLHKNTYSSALQGNNSTQYWIYDHQVHPEFFNQNFTQLMYDLKDGVNDALISYSLTKNRSIKFESAWSIIGDKNTYCRIHNHPNIDGVSSVLYLQVPEVVNEVDLSSPQGQIYFVLNSDNSTDDLDSQVIHITPEIGKLLIFPNWLLHGTYPQKEGIRQTLNTNLFI